MLVLAIAAAVSLVSAALALTDCRPDIEAAVMKSTVIYSVGESEPVKTAGLSLYAFRCRCTFCVRYVGAPTHRPERRLLHLATARLHLPTGHGHH